MTAPTVVSFRLPILAAVLAMTAGIGVLAGRCTAGPDRSIDRTRAAVCQVLDQLGADASTGTAVWPCTDLPPEAR